jgi:GNAT superfamily N-acetyltransferase
MRQTLVEVLGEEVGGNMYQMDWLVGRVLFHLDPERCNGAVFISEDEIGAITGHTIVRVEQDDEFGEIGLFSTTYVIPEARRHGTAAALLAHGEQWMADQKMTRAVTYTDVDNKPLQELYQSHGYSMTQMPNNFVALLKNVTEV